MKSNSERWTAMGLMALAALFVLSVMTFPPARRQPLKGPAIKVATKHKMRASPQRNYRKFYR